MGVAQFRLGQPSSKWEIAKRSRFMSPVRPRLFAGQTSELEGPEDSD